ncbi:hypothetical protein BH24ACT5_BH24ACT5_04730 [soil metagenome]
MATKDQVLLAANGTTRVMNEERSRLYRFTLRARGHSHSPWTPEGADEEYRDLARAAASNWIGLVISSTAQGLFVDGYRRPGEGEDVAAWEIWQRNRMDARQAPLYRAVLTHGYAYTVALPNEEGLAEITPKSGEYLWARYDAPMDEWPTLAVQVDGKDRLVYLDEDVWRLSKTGGAVIETSHGLPHPPIVRSVNHLDLLGTPMGEVEAVWPIQRRITETVFSLLMAQRFASFRQRWVTGMAPPLDENGDPREYPPPFNVGVDQLIMGESPDTKFGEFEATDLRQYISALEAHIRHMAAITQTPSHYLLAGTANPPSAEAMVAAEAGLQRKIHERRVVLGESVEQLLRLCLAIEGKAGADDLMAQVRWLDTESRSLSQVADALNKLAGKDGVRIPQQMLFEMIPGWTQTDVERALRLQESEDPVAALLEMLRNDNAA